MKRIILNLAVVSASLLAFTSTALAGDGKYTAALGVGAGASPDYEGSDDYELGAMPFLSLSWQSDPVTPKGGTGLQLGLHDITLNVPGSLDMGLAKFYTPQGVYRASLGAAYNGGRKEGDNNALSGMGKIKAHAMATAGLDFQSQDSGLQYGIVLHKALSSNDYGYSVNGQVGYAIGLNDQVSLTPSLHTSWADEDHMQSYFGVTSSQATSSTHSQFDATSGFKSVGLGAELNWMISKDWMMNTSVGYAKLTGDAADSPLVKSKGSSNQFDASAAVIYMF